MPDMNHAIASAKIGTHDTNGRIETEKLSKDKARRYTRSKPIGDEDRPIDRTVRLMLHRANRTQTIATTLGAVKTRLIDITENIPNDASVIDVYLDDIDGESGSNPARLNRTGRDFQSVTGGKRENAIAANRKIGKPVLKEPGFIIDRAMVRSVKVTTLRGETVYILRSVSKLKPVAGKAAIERKQTSLKRAVNRKAPIPLKDINGVSRLYDEILKDCKVSIDARSRRVVIDVIDDWLYYAYLTVTPVVNYAWQSMQYPDVAAYHNRLDGRTVGDRAIDLDHSETQKSVNNKGFSYPSKFLAYTIINTGTIVYARNDNNHTVTLCELKQSSIGHKLTIDRQLYASDGKKATIAVGVNFWGDLHKIVNGMYRTIANSDRRDSVKNTKRLKTVAHTLSFFPECATLTAPQKTRLAARIYDHETGSGRLWLDKERPEDGLLGICQKVKNGDRLAIAYLRNTIALVK